MQIKLFVLMQNLWINFKFTPKPNLIIVITSQFRETDKHYNWMEQELND